MSAKTKIAQRAAQEIKPGHVINLGIGIPSLIADYLPSDGTVLIHSENGILGMGQHCPRGSEDRNLINAGGAYVQTIPGAAFFDSALSFALIRGGRLDVACLGALEVDQHGNLANWIIPGKFAPGIGGGMELAQKARRLIVTTNHVTRKGAPKILTACTLPLTARACVDLIITELAVIQVTSSGLLLRELADGISLQTVQNQTEALLRLPPEGVGRF